MSPIDAPPILKKILYVEDDRDIRVVTKLILEVRGEFNVEACSSGVEALVKAPIFKPDVILLDVMMPSMDGPSTLQALRASPATASIPVIFMTGKIQPEEMGDYRKLGALGVIPKPFNPLTLATEIKTLCAGTQSHF